MGQNKTTRLYDTRAYVNRTCNMDHHLLELATTYTKRCYRSSYRLLFLFRRAGVRYVSNREGYVMAFRRNFAEKLKIVRRAGLEPTKDNVRLLNSVSKKNRKK